MEASDQTALKILDELAPVPTGPVRLPASYLRAVKKVEDHPDNQSGADKTWVANAIRQFEAHYERARLR